MLRQLIKEAREKRVKLIADARALLDKATTEKRGLNTEEREKYDKLHAGAEEVRGQVDDLEKQWKAEVKGTRSTDPDPIDDPDPDDSRDDDEEPEHRTDAERRALRDVRAVYRTANGGTISERATALLSDHYRSAFFRRLLGANTFTADETRAVQQAGVDLLGGAIVAPPTWVNELIQAVDDRVFVRQHADTVRVTTSEELGKPKLEKDVDDADWTSELQTGTETNVELGGRVLKPHPLAKLAKFSRDLARLTNIEGLVQSRLSYKFGVAEEKAFLTGDGHNKPLGVFTVSTQGISTLRDVSTGNTTTAVTFDGLKEAKWTLKADHLRSARWLGHRDFYKQADKIQDLEGRYVWEQSTKVGEPDRLLGLPLDISEFAPNTFTASKYVAALCDWSYYMIADAYDLEVQRLNELFALSNTIGLLGRAKVDGMPILEDAFVRVQLAA